MTASSRGRKAAVSLIRSARHPRVCSDCIKTISQSSAIIRRPYAVAAATLKTTDGTFEQPHIKQMPPVSSSSSDYVTQAGIILSRPPLITPTQTAFEKAFFFYQKRLNERLAMPFTRYFYFKKETPGDTDWKLKAKDRAGVAAKDIGDYQAYGELGWNDEALVGNKLGEPEVIAETLVKDSQLRTVEGQKASEVVEGIKVDNPLPRITEADRTRDLKRLDRKLGRTLYLVVRRADGNWGFPSGPLIGKENLHQAAERILVQSAGPNMNTWVVGHAPITHFIRQPFFKTAKSDFERAGEKTFFLKGRIMAGQADLKNNVFGVQDFRWLTKQELEKRLGDGFYSSIKNALEER
ncbi:50s ribosomal subunit l30 [Phlyctema vagabunda]|uniref:Large ribosomal subunit protein mL46 n=1 Tax=Phlyctema vagabunda TaxID=108571 RepID=A0ABR4P770_9HELO